MASRGAHTLIEQLRPHLRPMPVGPGRSAVDVDVVLRAAAVFFGAALVAWLVGSAVITASGEPSGPSSSYLRTLRDTGLSAIVFAVVTVIALLLLVASSTALLGGRIVFCPSGRARTGVLAAVVSLCCAPVVGAALDGGSGAIAATIGVFVSGHVFVALGLGIALGAGTVRGRT